MREIKFRGKRKSGSEWIVGDLNHINGQVFIFDRSSTAPLNSPDWYEVDPETVGQFTGLKDKNEKEIFEGDIVFESLMIIWEGAAFHIRHPQYKKGMDLPTRPLYFDTLNPKYGIHFKVIGNIHDNRELLNLKLTF